MKPTKTNPNGTMLQKNMTSGNVLSSEAPVASQPNRPTIAPGKNRSKEMIIALVNLIQTPSLIANSWWVR